MDPLFQPFREMFLMISFFDEVPSGSEKKESVLDKIRLAAQASPVFASEVEPEINPDDIDTDPEVIAAKEKAAEILRERAAADAELAESRVEINSLEEERRALEEQVRQLTMKMFEVDSKKKSIQSQTYTKRARLNTLTIQAEDAEKGIEAVRQNVAQRIKMGATVEQYARIASNYAWYNGITLPTGATAKCKGHQWDGMKFLASAGRAILGDGIGLGKSLTAIGALDLVGSRRCLVITQADLTSNFLRELQRWAGHRKVVNIKGKTKAERNKIIEFAAAFEPFVLIVNYEAWRKDLSLIDRLIDLRFDTVIADEAHNVKGTNTDAFSGLSAITLADNTCPYCAGHMIKKALGGRWCVNCNYTAGQHINIANHLSDSERHLLTKSIKYCWLMTGTPILNQPQDLWPMLYLIDPIVFNDKGTYLRRYCYLDQYDGKWRFKEGGLKSLMLQLSGHYLARTYTDAGVEIPPQDVIVHNIEFDEDNYLIQQDIINQLVEHDQIVLAEDNKMTTMGILSLITRQRQANVWPGSIVIWEYQKDEFGMPNKDLPKIKVFDASHVRESIKVDKAIALIKEHGIEGGNRIALYSQFKPGLTVIKEQLEEMGVRVVIFDGDTPQELREQIKTNFDKSANEEAKWEVVLCNYRTGGTGLTLTQATHTIILDEEWNPGKRDQAYGRTARMGQDENTFVHVIRVAGTIDEWLVGLIEYKERMVQGFNEATIDIQAELVKALRAGEIKAAPVAA